MRNITFILLALVWSIASCKPDPAPKPDDREPPKQYSYWVVNEDSFRTNNVKKNIGLGACAIGNSQDDNNNCFSIRFHVGQELPKTGTFLIVDSTFSGSQNIGYAACDFRYKNVYYYVPYPTNSTFTATSVEGKAQYSLPPTWFVNYYNHNDSVLIHGVFNEP